MTEENTLAALRSNDGLSDPFEAVLDTIDEMKKHDLTSTTRQIGFVTINGKQAQVQVCVDTNKLNWLRV